MKLSAIYQALAIACLSTTGLATLFLEDVPSNLTIGGTVSLKWTADHDYILSMSLMKQSSGAATYVESIFYDLPRASGNSSYDWVVPNNTVSPGDQFSIRLSGTGPMDSAGTSNSTNLFKLPVNVNAYNSEQQQYSYSSGYCDDSVPWPVIVGVTVGCVAAFFLGAAAAMLGMRLRQKRKTAGAGFEQVDNKAALEGATSLKAAGKEAAKAV